jgi:hypothetical protein
MAQFKELLVFGTTRVLGTVYATSFNGLATNAVADKNGKDITTYIANISGDGTSDTITFTYGDGTSSTFTTKDTQVTVADDLVTNDSTQALSAAQGVVLNGRLNTVESAVAWSSWDA